jgi:hypothetical protein
MNSLSRISRLAIIAGVSVAVGLLVTLFSANLTDLFALGASLFVLVIAATDYSSTARRIRRMRRIAPVPCATQSSHGLQLAA